MAIEKNYCHSPLLQRRIITLLLKEMFLCQPKILMIENDSSDTVT